MGVTYSLEYLEQQRAKLPQHPPTVPPFPAFDGDPLIPLYELVMQFALEGRHHRVWDARPRAMQTGRLILAYKPRHDSFVAAFRVTVWTCRVSVWCPDDDPGFSWGYSRSHLHELCDELSRGNACLSVDEIAEVLEVASFVYGAGPNLMSDRAVINALSFAAAKQPLPEVAYPLIQRMLAGSLSLRRHSGSLFRKAVEMLAHRPVFVSGAPLSSATDARQ